MSFLDVFLKVIAILGIIAVGTFIIVFLSDLLISIVDNSNGIFFRRNKNNTGAKGSSYYGRPKMITQQRQDEYEALTYNPQAKYNQQPQVQPQPQPQPQPRPQPVRQASIRPVDPIQEPFDGIDYEKAREEERLAAKASVASSSINKRSAEDEKTAERLRLIEARRREFEQAQKAAAEEEEESDTIDEDEIRRIIAGANAGTKVEEKKETKPVIDTDKIEKEIEERLRKEYESKQLELAEQLKAEKEAELSEKEAELLAKEEALLAKEEENVSLDTKLKDAELLQKEEREQLQKEIELLKKQLETANSTVVTLTKQVNEKPEPEIKVVYEKVITGNGMTKEEIEEKLAALKARLKANEKELSQNKKDFLPLKRVYMTLASDEKKLRRKEAMVAKKKVMLYGVNNYVDIDEEKAKELAEELDLLEGLKLSVQHCKEVMKANEDRYPILEKANKTLVRNIEGLKADIAELEKELAEFPSDNDDEDGGKKMDIVEEKPAKKSKKEEPEQEEPAKEQKEETLVDVAPVVEEKSVEEVKETSVVEEIAAEEVPAQEAKEETEDDLIDSLTTTDDVEALVNEILGTNKKNK